MKINLTMHNQKLYGWSYMKIYVFLKVYVHKNDITSYIYIYGNIKVFKLTEVKSRVKNMSHTLT